jgi:hypothetical protein
MRAAQLDRAREPDGVTQQVREYGWERVVETFAADLRYGGRRLLATPGFTAITCCSGARHRSDDGDFQRGEAVLLEPLPYPEAHRIAVQEVRPDVGRADGRWHARTRGTGRSFEEIAVFKSWQPTLTGRVWAIGRPARQRQLLQGVRRLATRRPTLRGLGRSNERLNVVVLSDALAAAFRRRPCHRRRTDHP